jgi:DNA modification methylase
MVDVDLLVPHPLNPNKHGERQIEMLAKIMNHQGWRHPITVSKRSGFIVAGHGRLMAAKKLGWTQAPVDRQEFDTEADEYAHLIADNKIAELAEHDDLKMFDDLKKFPDLDLDLLGIPDFELPMPEIVPGCDADDVPEALPEPKVVRGEVYILGNHRLMCGDSTAITDVERLMNGEKADMVFTDPPYGCDLDKTLLSSKSGYKKIENDGGENIAQFLGDVSKSYLFAIRDWAAGYWFYSSNKVIETRSAISNCFEIKDTIIWKKESLVPGRNDYQPIYEPIFYFQKRVPGNVKRTWNGNRDKTNLWDFRRDKSLKVHPTQKPVELIEFAIQNSSNSGDSLIDLFGGSGSTLIACEKTNRKCFMMELDPHYCGVILDRWQKFTGKKAHREDGVAWDEIRQ